MVEFSEKQLKDLRVLARFIELYCRARHERREAALQPVPDFLQKGRPLLLCPDCAALMEHGIQKRARCPLDPKPACKNCHIHCYSREYRKKIREIMAFSGKRMILRGRLDYLWHYYMLK